jgi:hypothetical protein
VGRLCCIFPTKTNSEAQKPPLFLLLLPRLVPPIRRRRRIRRRVDRQRATREWRLRSRPSHAACAHALPQWRCLLRRLLPWCWLWRVPRKVSFVVEHLVRACRAQVPQSVRDSARADAANFEHLKIVDELPRRQHMCRTYTPSSNPTDCQPS